jgi:hypothetical protein
MIMRRALLSIRDRFDRAGIFLSGLCAVHCVLGLVLVSVLGLGGGSLLAPQIHEIGLALAVAIGFLALGAGFARHGRSAPMALGAVGLVIMASALAVGHGVAEAVLTIGGVSVLASAHLWNLRGAY